MTGPADVRLLLPALTAWALVAGTLGVRPAWRVAGGLLLLVTGVLGGIHLWRHPRRLGPHARGPIDRGAAAVPINRGAAAVALCLVAGGLALSASGLHAGRREAGPLRALAQAGAQVRIEATVAGDPQALQQAGGRGRQGLVLVRLAVRSVDGRGQRSLVRSRILVFADPSWAQVRWGERVQARGRLGPARPGDDVVATLSARGPPTVLARASTVERAAERLRAGLRTASRGLAPDPRGLLPGLVVGDTSLQSPDLGQAMRATGLTHLSAVSGTNVTIVCVIALAAARAVGLGRRSRLVVAGLVLAGFVVLARPEPSVLRAAVMGLLGLVAVASARRRAALPALAGAVVLLLVVDPWLARSYGFALSVLATLGLLLLAPGWSDALSRYLPRPLATAIAVPLAAQAMCGPVVVLLSAQVSLVSLPANVIAAPFVAPATVIGLLAAVASLVSPPLAAALAQVAGLACRVITSTARRLADVDTGQVGWPSGVRGAVLLTLVTGVLVLAGPTLARWASAHRWPAAVLTTAVLATAGPVPGAPRWPPTGWSMVACDVGQGDALVLATGPGRAALIDAGPDPDAVDRCLSELGVRTLDVIVLTHFHADHVDGLPGALRGRRVGQVVVTIVEDPPAQARRVRATLAAAGIPVRTVVGGETAEFGALRWQVLWPGRVVRDGSVPNNASTVLLVQARGLRMLLLGDVEPAAARQVARRMQELPEGPKVDVLKVAHHGSGLQDPQLIVASQASLAIISVGAGNDYGHPVPGLLRTLAAAGAWVARTDLHGDVAVLGRSGRPAVTTSGPHRPAVGGRR